MSAISSCKFCMFFKKVFCILSCCPGVLFKKGICPDWTCNSSKDKLTTHESRPLHASSIFCIQSVALLKKIRLLQGNNILHESATETWDIHFKTAVSQPIFEKIMHLEKTYTFCRELCTVSLWICKIQVHIWKIYCMLCTIAASFKGDNGCRLYWTKHGCIPQLQWAVGCIEQKMVVFPSYRLYTDTPC